MILSEMTEVCVEKRMCFRCSVIGCPEFFWGAPVFLGHTLVLVPQAVTWCAKGNFCHCHLGGGERLEVSGGVHRSRPYCGPFYGPSVFTVQYTTLALPHSVTTGACLTRLPEVLESSFPRGQPSNHEGQGLEDKERSVSISQGNGWLGLHPVSTTFPVTLTKYLDKHNRSEKGLISTYSSRSMWLIMTRKMRQGEQSGRRQRLSGYIAFTLRKAESEERMYATQFSLSFQIVQDTSQVMVPPIVGTYSYLHKL